MSAGGAELGQWLRTRQEERWFDRRLSSGHQAPARRAVAALVRYFRSGLAKCRAL